VDFQRARALFASAATQGNASAQQALLKTDQAIAVAVNELRPLWEKAEAGDVTAQIETAKRYLGGSGGLIAAKPATAARYLEMAAMKNNPEAQFLLADLYVRGVGVEKNERKGVFLLCKAAARGHPAAALQIVQRYSKGELSAEEFPKAVEIFAKHRHLYPDYADPKAPLETPEQLEALADGADPRATYLLAMRQLRSPGADPSPQRGLELLKKAVELGSPAAEFELARRLGVGGEGIEKDLDKGKQLAMRAAQKGHAEASQLLATLFKRK
jgi:uncharacterized protein